MTMRVWMLNFVLFALGVVLGCRDDSPPDLDARGAENAACSDDLAAACPRLELCCGQLDDDEQEDCEELVDEADAAVCQDAATMFCDSRDPDASADPCVQLEPCCEDLDDEDDEDDEDDGEECEELVEEADAAACEEAVAQFCVTMAPAVPAPAADACKQLEPCCAQLEDDDDQEDCEELLEDDDVSACQAELAEFCS